MYVYLLVNSSNSGVNYPLLEGFSTMLDAARSDLERLPSSNLFDLARNPAAVHRLLALQLLVERGSHFASREEVASESRQFILGNPLILKRIDPAAAAFAASLPGVVDCLDDVLTKHLGLGRVVAEHHSAHCEKHDALKSIVADNKTSGDQALAQAYERLWGYFARQVWELAQAASDQRLETGRELQALREEHETEITAATQRLALLERSSWQKLADWCKQVVRAGRARFAQFRKPALANR
jgi:hypothetical protein